MTITLPTRFPQCGVLTNYVINRYGLTSFVLLEKTDGLRVNLHMEVTGNGVYLNNIVNGCLRRIKILDDLQITTAFMQDANVAINGGAKQKANAKNIAAASSNSAVMFANTNKTNYPAVSSNSAVMFVKNKVVINDNDTTFNDNFINYPTASNDSAVMFAKNTVAMQKANAKNSVVFNSNFINYPAVSSNSAVMFVGDAAAKANSSSSISIFDCEYCNGKLFVFDAIVVNNKDVSRNFYEDRMAATRNFFAKFNIAGDIIIKNYRKITTNDELQQTINFVNSVDISPETGNAIDGVIFQLTTQPYFTKSYMTCYKLKRKIMNTIDFYMVYVKETNQYLLYLLGNYDDYKFNKKLLPRNTQLLSLPNTEQKLILFANSYYDNTHFMDVSYVTGNEICTEGFNKSMLSKLEVCRKHLRENPACYNNKIIELCFDYSHRWLPLVNRTANKDFPNSYYVGLSNISVYFAPLTADPSYFNVVAKDNERLNSFHLINHTIRAYIINTVFETLYLQRNGKQTLQALSKSANSSANAIFNCCNTTVLRSSAKAKQETLVSANSSTKAKRQYSLLDLCGGRGADVMIVVKYGVTNVFCCDSDKDALTQYVSKINSGKYTKNDMQKDLLVNVIPVILSANEEETDNFIAEVKERYEFPTGGFDVILMNYAFHYLCYSHKAVRNLCKIVKELLAKDGVFAFTAYDGDVIAENIRKSTDGKSFKVGSFTITKIPTTAFKQNAFTQTTSNDKSNKVKDKQLFANKTTSNDKSNDEDTILCKMPLPTIDSTGYRVEPLVTTKYLQDIDLKLITEVFPVENLKTTIEPMRYSNEIIDYLRLIYLRIYRLL